LSSAMCFKVLAIALTYSLRGMLLTLRTAIADNF